MNKTGNQLLLMAVILPLILLFWPFAMWNGAMLLLLRVIPALAAQLLLYRLGKRWAVRAVPALLTGALAAWGTYLFCTSPHWSNATLGDLIADYVSPFLCCLVVFFGCLLAEKRK